MRHSQTWAQQANIIAQTDSQSILQLAQDCSSSLVALEDVASFITENTTDLGTRFEFDDVLQSTLLYQAADRSHLTQTVRAKRGKGLDNALTDSPAQKVSTIGFKQAFQAMKLKRSSVASDVSDTLLPIRVYVNREITVEHEPMVIEENSFPQNPASCDEPGDAETIDSDTETRRPSSIRSVDSDSSRPYSGFRDWRNAFQRRAFSARGGQTHQQGDVHDQSEPTKVLLLGTSGGGKTTFLNALRLSTNADYALSDRAYYRTLVWQNALDSARRILRAMEGLGMNSEVMTVARALLLKRCADCDNDPALTPQHALDVAAAISSLGSEIGFQEAIKCRNAYELHDNGNYYVRNISRLAKLAVRHSEPPLAGDLLRTEVTTTGMHLASLTHNGSQYCIYDFGGKRSERRKWTSSYDNVAAIIYPVDTTSYGRSLRENRNDDRMLDQMRVFDALMKWCRFAGAKIIVVFTKTDLLEDYLEEADVDVFLRKHKIISDSESRVTTSDQYLDHLERHFRRLAKPRALGDNLQFVRTNLVDFSMQNPAIDIFNRINDSHSPELRSISNIEVGYLESNIGGVHGYDRTDRLADEDVSTYSSSDRQSWHNEEQYEAFSPLVGVAI